MSFRILVGIYCHNIPTHTPQSGYHGVTDVAETADIAKMAKKCINCINAHPTPPHTNPMESGPGNTFSAQNRKKNQKFVIFDPKKRGGYPPPPPAPPPPPPSKAPKSGFQREGGGVRTKNSLGDAFIGQNNDFARG